MPRTLAAAFSRYQSEIVDLPPEDSDGARTSRDYLIEQIISVANGVDDFPALYDGGWHLPFGSFARKTKTQPLDDVDIMPILHGCSGTQIWRTGYTYSVRIYNDQLPLWGYADGGFVNSTKVLNKFRSELTEIPNYSSTEINKRGEAVVVNLLSYDWSFDVVPAFAVSDGAEGISHFLIPDGSGQWKKTDPRRDQDRITAENKRHNGNLIPLIRVMKFWNENSRHTQKIGSYHLETMIIDGLAAYQPLTEVRTAVYTAFKILQSRIMQQCPDPKGWEPPLDSDLGLLEKINFATTAGNMAEKISSAALLGLLGSDEEAIKIWQEVFPDFPGYED